MPHRLIDGAMSESLGRSSHIIVACVFLTVVIEMSMAEVRVAIKPFPCHRCDLRISKLFGILCQQGGAIVEYRCL